ncbi:PadR family transcriptional regulator [Halorubrum sp. E3]|nr:PadR family transcriptional regulator [Halorubrum sp. E3]
MSSATTPSTAAYLDLNAFQRDILWQLLNLDGAEYGLAIKEALEASGYAEVHHGRLYPNLDDLVEDGLVEKSAIDKRTNEYALTDAAVELLDERQSWERGESA